MQDLRSIVWRLLRDPMMMTTCFGEKLAVNKSAPGPHSRREKNLSLERRAQEKEEKGGNERSRTMK